MRTSRLIILSLLAVALACSCGKVSSSADPTLEPINFRARMSEGTRAIITDGSVLPPNYTIYVSSYFTSETDKDKSGDYFKAKPFNKSLVSDNWIADPMVYWPVGGYLTFLCVACQGDTYNINNANWSSMNCTDGVELNVADYSMMTSELLYTNAARKNHDEGSVALSFSHSQAWVRFALSCDAPQTMMIDSIVVKKAYVGGKFTVRNDVFATGEWSFRGHYRKNIVVPSSRSRVIGEETLNLDLLLPEQGSCDYDIYYRMRSHAGQSWDTAERLVYNGTTDIQDWYYGTRYLYTIGASRSEITIKATVQDWKNDSYTINVE